MKAQEIKRLYTPASGEKVKITKSKDAYDLLLKDWNMSTISLYEEFKAILLGQAGNVLGVLPLAKGGMTGCLVDVRLLMASCLLMPQITDSSTPHPESRNALLTQTKNGEQKIL